MISDSSSRSGTSWRFCPLGTQWRNGLAEAQAMKEALNVLFSAGAGQLNFAEFWTVLRKACNTVNDRPLAVKKSGRKSDGEILPVTPKNLLLGRTSSQPCSLIDSDDENRLMRGMLRKLKKIGGLSGSHRGLGESISKE